MKSIIQQIDEKLLDFLQSDLQFCLNGKVVKAGKLILFDHGSFNYVFIIQTKSKKTSVKIPFPFDFYMSNDDICFDYTEDKFTCGIPAVQEALGKLNIESPSKYYNNVLKIRSL